MPYYKRKAAARKMTKKPYRRYRKPSGITKAVRQSHRIKYFTETTQLGDWTITNAGVYQQLSVKLSDFINNLQYKTLFDQFTFVKFTLRLIPRTGTNVYGTSPGNALLSYNINRDGQVGPPSSNLDVVQSDYSRSLMLDGRRIITIQCPNPKPYLEQNDNNNVAVVVSQPLKKWVWLDTTNGCDTAFHGIMIAIETPSNTPVGVYTPMITATLAFKEQH